MTRRKISALANDLSDFCENGKITPKYLCRSLLQYDLKQVEEERMYEDIDGGVLQGKASDRFSPTGVEVREKW